MRQQQQPPSGLTNTTTATNAATGATNATNAATGATNATTTNAIGATATGAGMGGEATHPPASTAAPPPATNAYSRQVCCGV